MSILGRLQSTHGAKSSWKGSTGSAFVDMKYRDKGALCEKSEISLSNNDTKGL